MKFLNVFFTTATVIAFYSQIAVADSSLPNGLPGKYLSHVTVSCHGADGQLSLVLQNKTATFKIVKAGKSFTATVAPMATTDYISDGATAYLQYTRLTTLTVSGEVDKPSSVQIGCLPSRNPDQCIPKYQNGPSFVGSFHLWMSDGYHPMLQQLDYNFPTGSGQITSLGNNTVCSVQAN